MGSKSGMMPLATLPFAAIVSILYVPQSIKNLDSTCNSPFCSDLDIASRSNSATSYETCDANYTAAIETLEILQKFDQKLLQILKVCPLCVLWCAVVVAGYQT